MIACPACKSEKVRNEIAEYDDKFLGKVLINTIICDNCGFKHSDIFTEEKEEKIEIEIFVESSDDLNSVVVKSSKCSIKIPEMGIEITPGPYSESYITTIEGILERIENFLNEHANLFEKEKVKELTEKIKKMRSAEEKFHLILKDSTGISKIISQKARVKKIK
ncbi:MAG: ZPR1 zinc finger domain-containing protein [Candidatus Aenigmatarchaeota archaeon]